MAQTKKKRTRKKRGTQAGNIDSSRRSRPRSRAEAKNQARSGGSGRSRTMQKGDSPPNWRGATVRGLIASGVFVLLLLLLFGRPLVSALIIGAVMLIFYIPAGYYMDLFLWRRRERQRIRARSKG
ncbi:MAG: hypothetical protein KDB66_03195 [Solirubrobacterales bacterium]|nr:hypothetical protein [Solirubrobacterales bacterium]MCB8915258.1 hypothetical protein [Thermoleophilales bacterium]